MLLKTKFKDLRQAHPQMAEVQCGIVLSASLEKYNLLVFTNFI